MSARVHTARRHDSALKHVTGQALYIDDIPEPPGTLHGALVLSPIAAGRLRGLDLSQAAAGSRRRGRVRGQATSRATTTSRGAGKDEPLFAE